MVIQNELDYKFAFQQIEKLIEGNFEGDATKEAQFVALTTAVERYENDVLKLFPMRSTKDAVVFLKALMNHKKLKNNDLAHILHISENELFEIMQYQKPFTFEHADRVKKRLILKHHSFYKLLNISLSGVTLKKCLDFLNDFKRY